MGGKEKSERTWVPAGWPATSTEAWAAAAADLNVLSDEAKAEDMAVTRSETAERLRRLEALERCMRMGMP